MTARQLWWSLQMMYPENSNGEHEERDIALIEAAIRDAESAAREQGRREELERVAGLEAALRSLLESHVQVRRNLGESLDSIHEAGSVRRARELLAGGPHVEWVLPTEPDT